MRASERESERAAVLTRPPRAGPAPPGQVAPLSPAGRLVALASAARHRHPPTLPGRGSDRSGGSPAGQHAQQLRRLLAPIPAPARDCLPPPRGSLAESAKKIKSGARSGGTFFLEGRTFALPTEHRLGHPLPGGRTCVVNSSLCVTRPVAPAPPAQHPPADRQGLSSRGGVPPRPSRTPACPSPPRPRGLLSCHWDLCLGGGAVMGGPTANDTARDAQKQSWREACCTYPGGKSWAAPKFLELLQWRPSAKEKGDTVRWVARSSRF